MELSLPCCISICLRRMTMTERTGDENLRGVMRRRVPELGYYLVVTDTKDTENYMNGLRDSIPEKLKGKLLLR